MPPGGLDSPGRDLTVSLGHPSLGPTPGEVVRQLVQLPRVGLSSLHQVHLATGRGEGTYLLQQRCPGPIEAGSQVLILLGAEGLGETLVPTKPLSLS